MAKQKGLIRLSGKIGGLSLYNSKDGALARALPVAKKGRFKTDPRLKRCDENSTEFGSASSSASIIRLRFIQLVKRAKDHAHFRRLQQVFMKVKNSDFQHERGKRRVEYGNFKLLKGYNFNINAPFSRIFKAAVEVIHNKDTGRVVFQVKDFNPMEDLVFPKSSTHFRLSYGSTIADFRDGQTVIAKNPWMKIEDVELPVLEQILQFSQTASTPIISVMGIEFGQEMNGIIYALANGSYNSLGVVEVG